MKILKYILLVLAFAFINEESQAQCSPTESVKACIPKLAGGFHFLKSYEINGRGGRLEKVEYSYPFAKGTMYMINLCSADGGNEGLVVTLFDASRKQIATSVVNGQQLQAIVFNCQSTGIYYLTYTFDNSTSYCGGSALGFKR